MKTNKLREFRDELMKGREIDVEITGALAQNADRKRVVASVFRPASWAGADNADLKVGSTEPPALEEGHQGSGLGLLSEQICRLFSPAGAGRAQPSHRLGIKQGAHNQDGRIRIVRDVNRRPGFARHEPALRKAQKYTVLDGCPLAICTPGFTGRTLNTHLRLALRTTAGLRDLPRTFSPWFGWVMTTTAT